MQLQQMTLWIWHFMQIVSIGDDLHEMSKTCFWENLEIYLKMFFADFFTQSARCVTGLFALLVF